MVWGCALAARNKDAALGLRQNGFLSLEGQTHIGCPELVSSSDALPVPALSSEPLWLRPSPVYLCSGTHRREQRGKVLRLHWQRPEAQKVSADALCPSYMGLCLFTQTPAGSVELNPTSVDVPPSLFLLILKTYFLI